MKKDGVHQDFFTVPELPYKMKERAAILLFKTLIIEIKDDRIDNDDFINEIEFILFENNKDLVDWIMKYKGE